MSPIDYLKALGAAAAALALNLALTTVAITVYSLAIEPGHPPSFYTAMAPRIGAWTGPPGGALVLLGFAWLLGRRRPQRPALAFGAALGGAYVLIDGAMALAAGGVTPLFAVSMSLAVGGALAGAWMARRSGGDRGPPAA